MGLESTMICIDNSEFTRNGDYVPSRLEAEHDAANILLTAKINANPESTVGIMTMAGRAFSHNPVQVLVSPTEDMSKLLTALHDVSVGGSVQLVNALQVAQLALKHRRNKKGQQRIILFVASPVSADAKDKKALTKVAKLLKKNNVAVDVVSFGSHENNSTILKEFVDTVNGSANVNAGGEGISHLVEIPVGTLASDVLISSPVLNQEMGGAMGGGAASSATGGSGGDGFADYGGIDPSVDPELALALRVSMEEERARQEAIAKKEAEEKAKSDPLPTVKEEDKMQDDDDKGGDEIAMTEEEAMAKAMQMSMDVAAAQAATDQAAEAKPATSSSAASASKGESATGAPAPAPAILDPKFVNSLLGGLPGVNPDDPKIKEAIAQMSQNKGDKKDDKDDKKDEKK